MTLNNFTSKNKGIFLHVTAWIFILLINFLSIDKVEFNQEFLIGNAVTWVIYIVIFYVNYLLLLPKLLFKKRSINYLLCTLLLMVVGFTSLRTYRQYEQSRRQNAFIQTKKLSMEAVGVKFAQKVWMKKEIDDTQRRMSSNFALKRYNPFVWHNLPITYAVLIVFLASTALRFTLRWKKDEQNRVELEKARVISELEYLKQQINPHFLFNALNSIYSLTITNTPGASDSILKLSSILRYMLYETNNKQVPLSKELDVVNDYIGLHRLRLTSKTVVDYQTKGVTEGLFIEPLFLIPLIENAFKYGADSTKESFINIQVEVLDDMLIFQAENNIVFNAGQSERESSGIGIKNIQRRLELLFNNNYTFKTSTKENIFSVYLKLPLSNNRKPSIL